MIKHLSFLFHHLSRRNVDKLTIKRIISTKINKHFQVSELSNRVDGKILKDLVCGNDKIVSKPLFQSIL